MGFFQYLTWFIVLCLLGTFIFIYYTNPELLKENYELFCPTDRVDGSESIHYCNGHPFACDLKSCQYINSSIIGEDCHTSMIGLTPTRTCNTIFK